MSLSTLPGVPSSLAVSIGRESSNDGALASIRALLARGDSSRLASRESETPLAWAARSGDYTTVGRLLSAGVDPNGGRPLHAASLAVQHAIKTSRRLLGGGSDPEALDAHGRSAADVALAVGNQRLCEILVAAGAPLACGDPSDAAIANWEQAAQQPAFLALVRLLSSLCVRAPRLFRDRLRGFRGQGVVRLDFDLHAVAEYLGVDPAERRARPEDRESLCNAWLDELADEVRGRGFQLVRNVHLALDEPYSLLLFPTSDPFSILYAHDVDGRGLARVNGRPRLLDARGIIA
ncbi:MAG TPA: ankyrin repeat domain-containing protein, partial [Pirellulales bacterium]